MPTNRFFQVSLLVATAISVTPSTGAAAPSTTPVVQAGQGARRHALIRDVAAGRGGLANVHALLMEVLPPTMYSMVPNSSPRPGVSINMRIARDFSHITLGDNTKVKTTIFPGDEPYRSVYPSLAKTQFNVSTSPDYLNNSRIVRASFDGRRLTLVQRRDGYARDYEGRSKIRYQKLTLDFSDDYKVTHMEVANGRLPIEHLWKTLSVALND